MHFYGVPPWAYHQDKRRRRSYRRRIKNDVLLRVCLECRLPGDGCHTHPDCPWFTPNGVPVAKRVAAARARRLLRKWAKEDATAQLGRAR